MADHLSTVIWIGGDIPQQLVPALCQIIREEEVALDWGTRPFQPQTAEDLLAPVPQGETLGLYHERAAWGCFEQLEKFLEKHRIAFRRRCEGRPEHASQLVEYRPVCGSVTLETNAGGYPVVRALNLAPVEHLLEAALDVADNQPASRLLSLVRTALKVLREQLPPEVPPLEPLRVVLNSDSSMRAGSTSRTAHAAHTPELFGCNQERAERAARALNAYGTAEGPQQEDRLTDLLTDLRHYCQHRDMDWDGALEIAATHFTEEQPGE